MAPLFDSLGLPIRDYGLEVPQLQQQAVSTWQCTDTCVGLWVIYVHGVPLGMMYQPYRKSDPTFLWRDKRAMTFVRSQVLQCWLSQVEIPDTKDLDVNQLVNWAIEQDADFRPNHEDFRRDQTTE
jgi:hypothetical protein